MADPRFFKKKNSIRLGEIADRLSVSLSVSGQEDRLMEDVGPLSTANSTTISFLANRRYVDAMIASNSGAVLLEESFVDRLPEGMVGMISSRPYFDFARVAQFFYPEEAPEPGIHESATVDPSATVDASARVDAGAVVGQGVVVGRHAWIGANAVLDKGITVGEGTWVGAGAYLGFCDVGKHCRFHSGARIGGRGFGFAMDPSGYIDIPQIGRVLIGDFVEIGANTSVDRGMGPDTVIGDMCKIDNLVQIGHNVVLGKGCVIAGQAGVAGSAVLGDYVICGAQSGIAGHLKIGSGAQVAAKCGVIRDLEPGAKVGGLPAMPIRHWLKSHAQLEKTMRSGDSKGDAAASES